MQSAACQPCDAAKSGARHDSHAALANSKNKLEKNAGVGVKIRTRP
jgi:hypothetical protein